jgi:hypothetical protein
VALAGTTLDLFLLGEEALDLGIGLLDERGGVDGFSVFGLGPAAGR